MSAERRWVPASSVTPAQAGVSGGEARVPLRGDPSLRWGDASCPLFAELPHRHAPAEQEGVVDMDEGRQVDIALPFAQAFGEAAI